METKKIKLFVTSRKVKMSNGKSFIAYKVKMKLADDKSAEKRVRWIDLKFVDEGDNLKHSQSVKRGYITCDASKIDSPHVFRITKDKETDKDVYPCVYVHEFLDYDERLITATQDEFATEEDKNEDSDDVATSEEDTQEFVDSAE